MTRAHNKVEPPNLYALCERLGFEYVLDNKGTKRLNIGVEGA